MHRGQDGIITPVGLEPRQAACNDTGSWLPQVACLEWGGAFEMTALLETTLQWLGFQLQGCFFLRQAPKWTSPPTGNLWLCTICPQSSFESLHRNLLYERSAPAEKSLVFSDLKFRGGDSGIKLMEMPWKHRGKWAIKPEWKTSLKGRWHPFLEK